MCKTFGGAKFNKYSSFKSRGEREIADFLDTQDIAYQYEYPLAVKDRGLVRIYYPDFRLPDFGGTIIEYFGMNGNKDYNEQMAHKMRVYKDAGIDGIYLTDSTLRGPWQDMVLERIEQVLEGRLRKVQRYRLESQVL